MNRRGPCALCGDPLTALDRRVEGPLCRRCAPALDYAAGTLWRSSMAPVTMRALAAEAAGFRTRVARVNRRAETRRVAAFRHGRGFGRGSTPASPAFRFRFVDEPDPSVVAALRRCGARLDQVTPRPRGNTRLARILYGT